jgi:hypothetical protein
MKKLFIAIALLLVSAGGALAEANIAGIYWVTGTNPGSGSPYKGVATILKSGDNYRMHWEVGTSYDGVGQFDGKTLKVAWGTATANVGTVTYTLQADGSLQGTWFTANNPKSLGTETLRPKK